MRTPTGKKYNYCRPGTKLEDRLNSNDSCTREPINRLDSICQAHDIACSNAGDDLSKKHEADNVMIKQIGVIPFSQSRWFSTPVKYTMQAKRLLGLGFNPKKVKIRRVKKK